MPLNQNLFKQANVAGALDLTTNPNPDVFSMRFDPEAGAATLDVGEGCKLKDLGGDDTVGPPIVGERVSDVDEIFGVRVYTTKEGESDAGDMVEVAKAGAVVFMTAAAGILRGAEVSLVFGTAGRVQALGTKAIFGQTLDKAAAAEDLIRVLITADGITEGTT